MYSTCIFCHSSLGANEAIEHFPVGRRLVFDASRGRLWVVCRTCERWNLTPIEERWDAIEECERLFRGTRLRVSTDNIGLARIREGLELVRIGAPLRPEMAAWRYGDQFGHRRRKHMLYTGAGIAVSAGLVALGPATGVIAGSLWGLWNVASVANAAYQQKRVRANLILPGSTVPVPIRLKELNRVRIVGTNEAWALRLPLQDGQTTLIDGDAALYAAGKVLPAINVQGAKRGEVDSAVQLIGEALDPSSLFARYAAGIDDRSRRRSPSGVESGRLIMNLSKEVRLALEMATHEASERRALEGELALLETEWKQAEEIAAIADDMFVSDETRKHLSDLKNSNRIP